MDDSTAAKLKTDFTNQKSAIETALEAAKNIAQNAMADAAENDAENLFPTATIEQIAAANLFAAPLPERFGGIGLGLENHTNLAMLRLHKFFGYGNLVVGRVFEGHYNALLLIKLFGTNEQLKKYAADIIRENKIFGVWNTEAADGVRFESIGGDKYQMTGAKIFATGVDFVERPMVNGKLPDGGWQMCVVPLEQVKTATDASWWNPLGMKSSRSYRVDFTGVEVSKKDFVGAAGDYYRQPYFSGGAIRFAAVQFGGAEALFDLTREYLQKLNRTGDPYQKARLGEMAIRIESGNLWLAGAAEKLNEYEQNPTDERSAKFLIYAGMMRMAIEQICQDAMQFCARSVGARGLNKPFHFERIIRDLTIYLRQPAPDAALAEVGEFVLETETKADDLWRKTE